MKELFNLMIKDYKKFIKSSEKFIEKQKTKQKIKLENAVSKIQIMKEQLEEAKKTLKYYAETRIGTKTEEGTYIVTIKETPSEKVCIEYDPKPAIECLEKLEGGK